MWMWLLRVLFFSLLYVAVAVVVVVVFTLGVCFFFSSLVYIYIFFSSELVQRSNVGPSQRCIFCLDRIITKQLQRLQRHQQHSGVKHKHEHDEWNIRAAFVFVPLRSLYTFLWESFWSGNGMQSGNKHTQCVYVGSLLPETHTSAPFYLHARII